MAQLTGVELGRCAVWASPTLKNLEGRVATTRPGSGGSSSNTGGGGGSRPGGNNGNSKPGNTGPSGAPSTGGKR